MSPKRPGNNFECIEYISQFNEDFIKNCNPESDKGYLFEVDVQYSEKLHEIQNNLRFLPEIMKIGNVVTNLDDKPEYVIHIRNLKQALNNGLVLKQIHRVIKLNQNLWLKSYMGMNTDLKKSEKMIWKNYGKCKNT